MSEPSQPVPQAQGGMIAWFASNPVAANLLMLCIVVAGLATVGPIRKEFFPDIELHSIRVTVPYRGATPAEVEEGVHVKIEEAVQDIEGIDRVLSTAYEGQGQVVIEVETDFDTNEVLDEVKLRVDGIATFPEETERPIITEDRIRNEVIRVQLSGSVSERRLKEFAEQVRDEVTLLPGVTQAVVTGARDYEISIEVSEARLREYGLTFDDVVRAVQRSSLDLPAGSIRTPGGDYLLRTKGQAYTGEEYSDLVLLTRPDGTRILLGDIATVADAFVDTDVVARYNGQPSVSVRVDRVGDQSTLDVSETVRRYVEARQDTLPPGIEMIYWRDRSVPLKDRLNLMLRNAGMGSVLVFASLALFLRMKLAFWVIVGLPVSFLGALALMPTLDLSINMISLFGFILVLGILVDDAIVVGENVYTVSRRDGHSLPNVIRGAQEVALPATFGVLTTIAAFIPILMLPGEQGERFGNIAWVVILCLVFSLIESKLVLPAHLAEADLRMKPTSQLGPMSRLQRHVAEGLRTFILKVYRPVLDRAVRARYITLAAFMGVGILTVSLVSSGIVRSVMFPVIEADWINFDLQMAQGTPHAATLRAMDRVEATALSIIEDMEQQSGEKLLDGVFTSVIGQDIGEMRVNLVPAQERTIKATQIVNAWRKAMGPIPGAETVEFDSQIGNAGPRPIEFQLMGRDYRQLESAATEVKLALSSYAGVFDVQDSHSSGKAEITLDIRPGAEALGLTLQDLARQVRQAFYGAEAQRIQRGRDDIRVMVRYPEAQRRSLGDLENMRIRTATGQEVPFAAVADASYGRGYATIERIDRRRVNSVTADVDKDRVEPDSVIAQMERDVLPSILRKYPGVSYSLEGESRDARESNDALGVGAIMSLFLIYVLMAVPLKSYWKPVVIMLVIPFGLVGAVVGHWLMDLPISLLSKMGMLALSGVVVNDSLVMVDYINQREAEGYSRTEAVMAAGPARFRAIMLTSLTTFCGLIPMILEKSLQAQFLIPMAVSLGFGIVFATVITLFLVPCVYLIVLDLGNLTHKAATAVASSMTTSPRRDLAEDVE